MSARTGHAIPEGTHQARTLWEVAPLVSAPVYSNRGDAQELRCGQHTAGDLAAVGHKQLAEGVCQLSSCKTTGPPPWKWTRLSALLIII